MYRTLIRTVDGNNMYDISSLTSNIEYYTDINGQPGKLSFFINEDPENIIDFKWTGGLPTVGDEVFFSNEDNLIFKGFVFNVGTDSEGVMHVTAYDQMRYLMNEDTFVVSPKTASDLFTEICAERVYISSNQYKVVNASQSILESKVFVCKSYYSIMEEAFMETLRSEGRRYYLIDRAGVLEFNLLGGDISNVVIGEQSLMTGYRYEKDIDTNTYNKVVMLKGSDETGYTKAYIAQDEESITRWGLLQLMLKAPKEMNDPTIEEYARLTLTNQNKPSTHVTLSAIGDDSILAGTIFRFSLPSVGIESRWLYASSCSHKYDSDVHTMELEVSELPEDLYES